MFAKVLFCFVFVGTVCLSVSSTLKDYGTPYQGGQVPFFELPCMKFGGVCMQRDECPDGKQAESGLCPLQQEQGVECCYSATPKSASTCKANAGECMSISWKCPDYLQVSRATDCEADEHCCIMVNK